MDGPDLAEHLMRAPAGVSLLQVLVAEQRDTAWPHDFEPDSDPAAVHAAANAVESMTLGSLLRTIVSAADRIAGPWTSDAPSHLAAAYRLAPARAELAGAIAQRFGAALHAEIGFGTQQWWAAQYRPEWIRRLFVEPRTTYCCGEFTWQGFWTITDPSPDVHDSLADVWELEPGPISRWRFPIAPSARVFEIHSPLDWRRLVATYPRWTDVPHSGWELPGPNQHYATVHDLESVSGGAASRTGVRVAMPDWSRVAEDFDGVHLSWAGMLTAEGHVVAVPELGPGVATMVRYWRSEHTHWLNDVFGIPEPMAAPQITSWGEDARSIATIESAARRADDARVLAGMFGRDPFVP